MAKYLMMHQRNITFCYVQWRAQEFCSEGSGLWGGSTNLVEDRRQTERESGDGSPPSQGFWRQL